MKRKKNHLIPLGNVYLHFINNTLTIIRRLPVHVLILHFVTVLNFFTDLRTMRLQIYFGAFSLLIQKHTNSTE